MNPISEGPNILQICFHCCFILLIRFTKMVQPCFDHCSRHAFDSYTYIQSFPIKFSIRDTQILRFVDNIMDKITTFVVFRFG